MEELLFSTEEILERVDEYTLYSSYLDYEPLIGAKYHSPIRTVMSASLDEAESFGIFIRNRALKNMGDGEYPNEFLWTDAALGITGDIFELVRRLCKLSTRRQAIVQVMIDCNMLPGEKSRAIIDVTCEAKFQGYAKIDITPRPLKYNERKYWEKLNINQARLNRYQVQSVRAYWLYEDQTNPRFPPGMGFAYQIWDKYQLYFPEAEKKRKFKTDWTEPCVPGFLQLQYNSPTLIITKSMKDVMCLNSFGYEAISPRGENIMLPPECISLMQTKYERILILFDNDMKHKGAEYSFEKIYIPQIKPTDKDTTDFCTNHGIRNTAEMLRQIIQ